MNTINDAEELLILLLWLLVLLFILVLLLLLLLLVAAVIVPLYRYILRKLWGREKKHHMTSMFNYYLWFVYLLISTPTYLNLLNDDEASVLSSAK